MYDAENGEELTPNPQISGNWRRKRPGTSPRREPTDEEADPRPGERSCDKLDALTGIPETKTLDLLTSEPESGSCGLMNSL